MRFLMIILLSLFSVQAMAAQSRVPEKSLYEAMLEANKPTGWVVFQTEDGQQRLYFTPVASMLCGLSEVRYSLNSDALDKTFPLGKCVPQTPFVMTDRSPEAILRTFAPGTVKTVSVQVVFTDGTESEIMTYEPCEDIGTGVCAWPLED